MEQQERSLKIAILSIVENDFRFPIIGPMIIVKAIKDHCKNIKVCLIDNTFDDVYNKTRDFSPDIVGFSTFTQSYPQAINFAKKIKRERPNVKIVIGGPHITTLPESLDPIFDFGVIGEGEKIIVDLIEAIRGNRDISKIQGLVYFKNKKLVIKRKKGELGNIDDIFPLDYSLLNKGYFKKKFIPEVYRFGVSMGIMTSIGCPFNCRFCSIRACWKNIRFRNIDNVIEEIKDLYYNYKVRNIDLLDDLFTINRPRILEFREKLRQAGLLGKVTFSCQARANLVDDEICILLKSLNVKTVVMGFESGSDRVLKFIKKDLTLSAEVNKNAVRLCRKHKLNVYGGLMLGIPGEKLEDIDKTIEFIDFALKIGVARIWTQILIPLPSTEIWEIAKSRGKINNELYENIPNSYNKENPLLLDADVPLDKFIKKYILAKKKCRYFLYRIIYKTVLNDPSSIYYFLKENSFYLKRLKNFVKQ